jgi:hypothetical protein
MLTDTKYKAKFILILGIALIVIANGMNHWWISSISLKIESESDNIQKTNRYIASLWKQYEKKEQIVTNLSLYTMENIEETVDLLKSFYQINISSKFPKEMLEELTLERDESIEQIDFSFASVLQTENNLSLLRQKKEMIQSIAFLLNTLGLIVILIRGNTV